MDELKSIIDRLPETPEAEKKLQEQMEKNFKQRKKAVNPKLEPIDENSEAFKAGMRAAQKSAEEQGSKEKKSE